MSKQLNNVFRQPGSGRRREKLVRQSPPIDLSTILVYNRCFLSLEEIIDLEISGKEQINATILDEPSFGMLIQACLTYIEQSDDSRARDKYVELRQRLDQRRKSIYGQFAS